MKNREADEGVRIIDEFFETESKLTEEDRLRYGLKYGVEHGLLTEEEATLCEQAFVASHHEVPHTEE